jgi:GTP cyclohydrolase I
MTVQFNPNLDLETDIKNMRDLLSRYAGVNEDEHGMDTPSRFLHMLDEMTACRNADDIHMTECIKWKSFPASSRDMVVVENIKFVSICNHHLAPFTGVAHIAYIPNEQIAGLSKFPRVVEHFARQAQVQEELTNDIATYLEKRLEAQGVAVILRAEHQCMAYRGVRSHGVLTTTSSMRGHFADHTRTAKAELMAMIGQK